MLLDVSMKDIAIIRHQETVGYYNHRSHIYNALAGHQQNVLFIIHRKDTMPQKEIEEAIELIKRFKLEDEDFNRPDMVVAIDVLLDLAEQVRDGKLVDSKEVYQYLGGEDDGYGGKTLPITWKEAYEEQDRYETWAMKEMKKACEKIKANPQCKFNEYPSPYERTIVAGCGQAIEELQEEIKKLRAKPTPLVTAEWLDKVLPQRFEHEEKVLQVYVGLKNYDEKYIIAFMDGANTMLSDCREAILKEGK